MKHKIFHILVPIIFAVSLLGFASVLQADASIPLQAVAASDATSVSITGQGLDPSEVSVSVGSAVVWTNSTGSTVRLVSGDLHLIYLPLAVGANNGTPTAGEPQQETKTVFNHEASWLNVAIEPGNAYTFTFTTAGSYPYYIANPPFSSGLVEVTELEVIDLYESVLVLTEDTSAGMIDHNPSLALGVADGADFTIEAHFYVPDESYEAPGVDVLARKRDVFSFYIDFFKDSPDKIFFTAELLGIGEIFLLTETDLQTGWHHVAAVFDNEYTESEDAMIIYLDGQLVATSLDGPYHPDWTPGLIPNTRPLDIGGVWGGSAAFHGYLEEIRISDITRYTDPTYTVPDTPFLADTNTIALWHFDEAPGSTTFMDASSYGNNLTGYGGAQTIRP